MLKLTSNKCRQQTKSDLAPGPQWTHSDSLQPPEHQDVNGGGYDGGEIEQRPLKHARDCLAMEWKALKMAQDEFQVWICTEYAFPEEMDDTLWEWATDFWKNACKHMELLFPLTHDILSLVYFFSFNGP